jgi:hypothetical protein
VRPIVLAAMGLLWSLPVPSAFSDTSAWLNWATLVTLAALLYYWVLSPSLTIGMVVAFICSLAQARLAILRPARRGPSLPSR